MESAKNEIRKKSVEAAYLRRYSSREVTALNGDIGEEKQTSSRSKRISYASSTSYVSTKKPSPNSKPQIRHAFG